MLLKNFNSVHTDISTLQVLYKYNLYFDLSSTNFFGPLYMVNIVIINFSHVFFLYMIEVIISKWSKKRAKMSEVSLYPTVTAKNCPNFYLGSKVDRNHWNVASFLPWLQAYARSCWGSPRAVPLSCWKIACTGVCIRLHMQLCTAGCTAVFTRLRSCLQ